MKVLGLVASPRKLGNSEILVKEMLASLPEEVSREMIRLTDLTIKSCNACYSCLPAECACQLQDDLTGLLARIKAADAVIIASACYFLGPHTSIKTIGDRLISILANGAEYRGKKCVTAVTYGVQGWEGYAREGVRNFAHFLHLDVVGSMSVQAANPGEAIRPEVLAEAGRLAERIIRTDGLEPGDSGAVACAGCGSALLRVGGDGTVICPMCGMRGGLQMEAGKITAAFIPQEPPRFSAAGVAGHARRLTAIKDHYLTIRRELSARRKRYADFDWWVKPDNN